MIALCMDTSHIFLCLALIKDDKVIASVQKPCFKRQSEELFPELDRLMEETALKPEDIDEVVITEGPGSYTGVRIAMTAAKVFCALKDRPIYTLGTLQLYAGNTDNCRVILDARGKRAYTAVYSGGNIQGDIAIEYCQDIKIPQGQTIVGDGHLVGLEDSYPNLSQNFLDLKREWKKADNVHLVKPEYLKPSEAYLLHHDA